MSPLPGSDTAVSDLTSDTPKIRFTDRDGNAKEVHADIVVGADGSGGICKRSIPQEHRTDNFVEYPFAWFGILAEAPPSSEELIYCNSDRGFALISQRNDTIQRMYFQCPTDEDVDKWTEEMIWDELQLRLDGPDGFQLKRGHIFDKMVLRFRSYVCEPLRYGNLFLAGDAGHTVPPTGAKGLNLAFADVRVLFEGIESWASTGSRDLLDQYSDRALQRIWKAQNFSYWMTSMLHEQPNATAFERKRQLGELDAVVNSRHGSAYLAEAYTGWPSVAFGEGRARCCRDQVGESSHGFLRSRYSVSPTVIDAISCIAAAISAGISLFSPSLASASEVK